MNKVCLRGHLELVGEFEQQIQKHNDFIMKFKEMDIVCLRCDLKLSEQIQKYKNILVQKEYLLLSLRGIWII